MRDSAKPTEEDKEALLLWTSTNIVGKGKKRKRNKATQWKHSK